MTGKLAVVGATGAVGRELLRVLEERAFPVTSLLLFASGAANGRTLPFRSADHPVQPLFEGCFQGADLVFFATEPRISRRLAPAARAAGALVIDNSSAFRSDPAVPLVVPEVNGAALAGHDGLIANPNCTTILLVLALGPLCDLARPEQVVVCSYQAVSGAGSAAVEELDRQLRDGQDAPVSVFQERIAENVIPVIGSCELSCASDEEFKVQRETRRILGRPDLAVSATCVRVPVERSHSEAVHIGFDRPVAPADARERLLRAPGVTVVDDPGGGQFPTPLRARGGDAVLVGRIRIDPAFPAGLALFLAGDQLRKGAALNAVQIAEATRA